MAEKASQRDVLRIVAAGSTAFEERRMALVGGQALLFWTHRYRFAPELITLGEEPLASRDIDFTAGQDVARAIALAIGGRVQLSTDPFDPSPTNAIVTYRDADGDLHKIDFIKVPHGLKENMKSFMEQCITVTMDEHKLRVMTPFQVLKSRLANLATLPTHQGTHSQAQCKASIYCMREFTRELANTDPRSALKLLKKLKAYLLHDKSPNRVWRDVDIDAREAVLPPVPELPADYASKEYPALMARLARRWERGTI